MEKINIDEIIYKWFEMKYQTYDKLEHGDSIYLYYDGEKYAEIWIDKISKNIYYRWKLYDEFSEIISIQKNVFQEIMSKWVGDTFGLKGFTAHRLMRILPNSWLTIPKIKNQYGN